MRKSPLIVSKMKLARVYGTYRNMLLTGPDLVNSLCGVLLRFLGHFDVLVADIEAMFHHVKFHSLIGMHYVFSGGPAAALLHIGQFHLHEKYASCGLSAETLHRDILFRRVQLNQPGVYVNVEIRIVPGELSLSSPHLMVVELSTWRSDPPPPLSTVANSKTPNMLPMLSQPLDAALIAPIRPSADIQGNQRSDLLVWVEHEAQRIPVFVCPAGCQDMPVEVKCQSSFQKVFGKVFETHTEEASEYSALVAPGN
ncbi:hypothetical protein X801_09634 [Opisthorchis viverrini]|uniref:Uncharacterized protein n=1 Tax=Opisthorchis viverrini TaxID=6198 RepID=A0A1S8WJG3_OPIVI|nr:hypothetical protein X801_09634 [Opisthorchis viverrini]